MSENKSYRIRTKVGEEPGAINLQINQSYDLFEILSLKLTQEDAYKLYSSAYGVIVGRVLANGGFGIPNAKISVFIEVSDSDYLNNDKNYLYPYFSTSSVNNEGVRYNLLPDEPINDCYQNVGTFPNKRLVLDNDTILEIYDTYWKYTSVTNEAGDYMIFGVPTGEQEIHVDIDLSDIGVLSQRPRDMVYKGYNINQFESPNKFKQSTNLNSLSQIYSQNIGVNVYPFWGDTEESNGNIAITRADIQIEYLFEPTCVFIGSIISDSGTNAIGKNCTPMTDAGKMDQLMTGEGSIEMIRKTLNGLVEEYQIKGNRLIDGDGVWCYQIPMNLDYVTTDEYGNIVPTDDPSKGIPTRTKVRFRVSLDESQNDATARKRCKLLIPNNPRINADNPSYSKSKQVDYEFGTSTTEESYRNLYWNKVYSVKSYIPRLQNSTSHKNRKHSGIKMVNHYGTNNPAPYNNVSIKLGFMFRLICVIAKVLIELIGVLNIIISLIGEIPCRIYDIKIFGWRPFKFMKYIVPSCVKLTSEFCDDEINRKTYYPRCFSCVWDLTQEKHEDENRELIGDGRADEATSPDNSFETLFTCVENELAQDNDVTSFNFENDWLNGALYAPLWFRKITPKKSFLFGIIKIKAKDQWCAESSRFSSQRVLQPCSLWYGKNNSMGQSYKNNNGKTIYPYFDANNRNNDGCNDNDCHKSMSVLESENGLIVNRLTMLKQTVYYYSPVYYDYNIKDVQLLYATDIILLGSLNDCDLDGAPQFFKYLESSTYNMPSDILFTDTEVQLNSDGDTKFITDTEMTGADWGNYNPKDECNDTDGGLFYGIGCSSIEVHTKSCANLQRICEFGVSLDETISIRDISNQNNDNTAYSLLVADGFVSKDELNESDARSMFATLNGNNLKTKLDNTNGLTKYDFNYIYPNNFNGSMYSLMKERQGGCGDNISYRYNYNLEQFSRDYYKFRMGDNPLFYKYDGGSFENPNLVSFPRYENSFYFYFGLHNGKTAIDKFNSQFFSTCLNTNNEPFNVGLITLPSTWCNSKNGTILLNLNDISTPYEIIINGVSDGSFSRIYSDKSETKIYIGSKSNEYPDYSNILDEDGKNEGLPNGDYEISITDDNGSIVQKEISLVPQYLSYGMSQINFRIPNNMLKQTYSSFNNVRISKIDGWQGDGKGWKNGMPGENSDSIGGRIVLGDVFVIDEQLSPVKNNGALKDSSKQRGYTIFMTKLVEETSTENITDENGITQTINKVTTKSVKIQLTEQEILAGILECDEGGQSYQVDVVELCKDGNKFILESKNITTKIVTVTEPLPVKMIIKDVDYELIKNFKTGWVKSGDKWVQQQSSFYGWNKIGDINNPAYNWSEAILKLPDNPPEKIQTKAKEELISKVKSAFWITCSESQKSINVVGQSDYYPISYGIQYQGETSDEIDSNIHYVNDFYTITDATSVSEIKIPTLLSLNSDNSGQVVANYGKLNSNKIPYFFVMKDNKGNTIPNLANVENPVGNSDTDKWFGIHLLDKILTVDKVSWAGCKEPQYFQELPYGGVGPYWEAIKNNGYYNGFFRGIINNGVVTNELINTAKYCRPWQQAKFDAVTVGQIATLVETITLGADKLPDEDALPTKRRILGSENDKTVFGFPCEKPTPDEFGPAHDLKTAYNLTAIPVSLYSVQLTVEDNGGNCSINETIYGAMEIVMSGGLNNSKNDAASSLNVSIRNGDTSKIMTYVMITSYNQVFKYPNHEYSKIEGNGAIFASGVTQDDIINQGKTDAIATSTIMITNEEGDIVPEQSIGYGNSGIFENIMGTPTVYIVGMTQNNCRVVSPVYDFRKVSANITLNKVEEVEEPEVEEPIEGEEPAPEPPKEKVTKYKFIVTIKSCEQWYISNFNSVISTTCNIIENNPFGSTITFTDKKIVGSQFVTEITSDMFNEIMELNPDPLERQTVPYTPKKPVDNLLNATTVDITDKLGMVTRCKLSYKNPKPIIT